MTKLFGITKIARLLGLVGLSLCVPAHASTDAFPAKPIRIVVAYAAGGPTDTLARQLGAAITAKTGQQVIVDNRPGGATVIATRTLLQSPSDGYTVGLFDPTPVTINPFLFKKLPYNADSLVPVTRVTKHYLGLAVRTDSPLKSVADYVAAAKAAPGTIMFATAGLGANTHLMGERFSVAAGINTKHVPYKGEAPALQDLIGGTIPTAWTSVSPTLPYIKAGQLRLLAIMSEKRVQGLPDVPTFAEAGYPDFITTSWFGVFAPPGTPAPVVDKLNAIFQAAAAAPNVKDWLKSMTMDPMTGSPQEFQKLIKADSAVYGDLIKRIGLTLD